MSGQKVPGARYAGLTALRGLAAMMVVLIHLWGIHQFELPAVLGAIVPHLTLGVPLFFVISAYSLCLSTAPRIDQPGWLNDFLIRRFMRIAPLFYLMSFFYFAIVPEITGGPHRGGEFLLSLTFLFGFMPKYYGGNVWAGWSIGVEMIFYVVLPLILVTVRRLRDAAVFAVLSVIVSGAFIDYYRENDFPKNYDWFSFFGSIGIFGADILGYFLTLALRDRATSALLGLGCLAGAVLTGALVFVFQVALTALPFTLALCSALPFMLLVVSQVLRPIGLVTNRVFIHLGDLSFSLYLLHPPIIYFAKPIYVWLYDKAGGPGLGYGLSIVATLCMLYPAAQIAHRLVERPGIRYGEAWIKRRRARDAAGAIVVTG